MLGEGKCLVQSYTGFRMLGEGKCLVECCTGFPGFPIQCLICY